MFPSETTLKSLSVYIDALEKWVSHLEDIIKTENLDPKQTEESLRIESKNYEKIGKEINSLDKKINYVETRKGEDKQIFRRKCLKCRKEFFDAKTLKEHMRKYHSIPIKCRFCDESFLETWMLEKNLNCHEEKRFRCDQCEQKFHLKWRLKKHMESHTNVNTKFCHFFNNEKECPYIEPGCMFKHEISPHCYFQKKCNKNLCQFQHTKTDDENIPIEREIDSEHSTDDHLKYNDAIVKTCSQCDRIFASIEELELHKDSDHKKYILSLTEEEQYFDLYVEHNFAEIFKNFEDNKRHIHCYYCSLSPKVKS